MSDMRLLKIAGIVALVLVGRAYVGSTISKTLVAYTMSPSCAWRLKSWAKVLGASERPATNQAIETAEWECHRRRGQKSRSPFINTILPRWPSASQRRTWEMTDEDRGALSAEAGRPSLIP